MEKPAETQLPIHPLIRRRWSPRAFSSRPVAPETLLLLLEAARWSASCFNQQPWRFLVARREDAGAHAELLSCLVEANALWARHAPVLMLSVAVLRSERDGSLNRHALHDVGLAVQQLTLQATAEGLVVHQMAGFDLEQARSRFSIPDDCEPVAVIAVGYPGDPGTLPERLLAREMAPRIRKPLVEMVFGARWSEPYPPALDALSTRLLESE